MKSLIIIASVIALAVAGPAHRSYEDTVQVGPALIETEPISVGPAIIETDPISVGPALIESEPVSVGPAMIEDMPVSVGPALIDNHPIVGPALVDAFEPVAVGPAIIDTPAAPAVAPLVQIILNINQAAASPVEVAPIVPEAHPVQVVDAAPEPIDIGVPIVPAPEPAEIGTPVLPELLPEPVVIGTPELPAVPVVLPEELN